jgi:hypothetical protein
MEKQVQTILMQPDTVLLVGSGVSSDKGHGGHPLKGRSCNQAMTEKEG